MKEPSWFKKLLAKISPATRDQLERIFFAVAYVAIGLVITKLASLPNWWAIACVSILATIKTQLAKKTGDQTTAGFVTNEPPS
jgi:hypothetical protein